MRYSVLPSRYCDSSWSGAIFGSFISSQAASAALSYSPRLKDALAASSRCRSAVRPVTSSASKVVVGAVPFFGGGGGGSCCALAGGGADRSIPMSCEVAFAGVAAGVDAAGTVALAGAAEGAVVLAGAVVLLFEAADLVLLVLLFLAAFFFGCWGESRPWNVWAHAPPAITSGRSRTRGRSERNISASPP